MKTIPESKFQDQAECFRLVYDSGDRYVNDHCFIADKQGRLHLFHIVGPNGKGCYDDGSEVSFGHAVSDNLVIWTPEKDILSIDPDTFHEPHHIFAPYVIEKNNVYYLFYSGINQEAKIESMCLATSEDLYNWNKHPSNPIFRPSQQWAEHSRESALWGCCRDAHVIPHPEYGFILYYVTWLKNTGHRLVALGAAVSDNLVSWQDAGPVMVREFASDFATTSMESPCVVVYNDIYYLFYKHRNETRLVMSDNPFMFTDKEDTWFSIAHATEIFQAKEKWYISSCSRDPLDIRHETTDRTKGLYLASIDWHNTTPVIIPFEEK